MVAYNFSRMYGIGKNFRLGLCCGVVSTFFLLQVLLVLWMVSGCPCVFFSSCSLSPFGPVGSLSGGLWSSGDIKDTSPGFPLVDLHIDSETDTAACSEISRTA